MDIVEFLRARLDEDEHEASSEDLDRKPMDPQDVAAARAENTSALEDEFQFERLVISKGRVLREVEAKRRIIALWERSEFCERIAMDDVLDLLALPYADHPDFQQEWREKNWESEQT